MIATAEIPQTSLTVPAPVRRVTITEDQADVRREAPVSLGEGPQALLVPDVTPALIDATLWADVVMDEGPVERVERPEVGSVRCVRWLVPESPPDGGDGHSLEAALEALALEALALQDAWERLAGRQHALAQARPPALQGVLEQVALDGAPPEQYGRLLDGLVERIGALHLEDFQLGAQARALAERFDHLAAEWRHLKSGRERVRTRAGILITLEARHRGTGTLRCGYQVPCAQWRPQHEAHLVSEEKVLLVSHGVVWQHTGEDWADVELTLFTAKPSLGLDAALPGEDLLRLRDKTREEMKRIRVEARDQAIQSLGGDEGGEPPLPSDGGETQVYLVPGAVSLASNGRPAVLRLESGYLEAATAMRATPELDGHVFCVSRTRNNRSRPILAGPVALHRSGTYVGTGQVDFVGSNEPFQLWWGSEDLLRIERYVDEKEEDATLLQCRRTTTTVTVRMRNLAGEDARFQILERVPVSELAQVRVKVKRLPDGTAPPDANGFVTVDVALGPREERTCEVSWVTEMDGDVEAG